MSHTQNDIYNEAMHELEAERAVDAIEMLYQRQNHNQAYDNLFSANHRNQMAERYGYTDAQFITLDDLSMFN